MHPKAIRDVKHKTDEPYPSFLTSQIEMSRDKKMTRPMEEGFKRLGSNRDSYLKFKNLSCNCSNGEFTQNTQGKISDHVTTWSFRKPSPSWSFRETTPPSLTMWYMDDMTHTNIEIGYLY